MHLAVYLIGSTILAVLAYLWLHIPNHLVSWKPGAAYQAIGQTTPQRQP